MKNEFFYEQTYLCQQIDSGINQTKQILIEVLEQWNLLTKQPLTVDMVKNFLDENRKPIRENVENEFMKPILKKSPLFGEIPDAKLKEMLIDKLPDLDPLMEKLTRFSEFIQFANFADILSLQCFAIKGGEIEILDQELDKLKSKFRYAATTPDELKRLELVKNLCSLLETIADLAPNEQRGRFTTRGLTEYDNLKKMFVPDPFFIQNGYLVTPIMFHNRKPADNLKSELPLQKHFSSVPGNDPEIGKNYAERRNATIRNF